MVFGMLSDNGQTLVARSNSSPTSYQRAMTSSLMLAGGLTLAVNGQQSRLMKAASSTSLTEGSTLQGPSSPESPVWSGQKKIILASEGSMDSPVPPAALKKVKMTSGILKVAVDSTPLVLRRTVSAGPIIQSMLVPGSLRTPCAPAPQAEDARIFTPSSSPSVDVAEIKEEQLPQAPAVPQPTAIRGPLVLPIPSRVHSANNFWTYGGTEDVSPPRLLQTAIAVPPGVPKRPATDSRMTSSRAPPRLQQLDDQTHLPREVYSRMMQLGDKARGQLGYGQHKLCFAGPGGAPVLRLMAAAA